MLLSVLITVIHVIVCFFLIAVVLLQSGKSGD
jgi:protein translocase SecG subunit